MKISPDGSRQVLSQKDGDYLRTADGRVLITERRIDNGVAGEVVRGTFEDLASGRVYRLDYSKRRAVLRSGAGHRQPLTEEYKALAEQHAVDKRMVNGVMCLGFPAKAGGTTVGIGWRSLDLDLHVRSEAVLPDGVDKLERVREIYDIQVGAEPPADTVSIPAGFEVIEDGQARIEQ